MRPENEMQNDSPSTNPQSRIHAILCDVGGVIIHTIRTPALQQWEKSHSFQPMGLPLAIWLLWLLLDIYEKSVVAQDAFIVFSVVCLPFALYHSFTFLSLAGSIIHLKVLDRPVSARLIVLSQFALWAGASVVIAALLIWLSR